jgi:hypothetical protein
VQLYPDFSLRVWEAQACAPLVRSGPNLERARRKLLRRLPRLGYMISEEPSLRFLTDARRAIEPQGFDDWFCLALPSGTRNLSILSRQAAPAEVDPASRDCRRLGVPLTHVRLDGELVALDGPRLLGGWHAPEPDLRWTDGAAVLDVNDASVVEFRFASGLIRYVVPSEPPRAPEHRGKARRTFRPVAA